MKKSCIDAVNQAAGRILSDAEIRGIDSRIEQTMTSLAKKDLDAWRAMPMNQRVLTAAMEAQKAIQAEASRKLANVQRQVLATARVTDEIADLKARGMNPSQALVANIDNVQHYIDGVKRQYVSELMDLVKTAKSGQGAGWGKRALMFLFDASNPQMTRDLVTEIFANGKGNTGNSVAKAGAEAWLKVTDGMRQRFNAAGGDIGKLLYGYLPQPHDVARIRAAGRDLWVNKLLPLLDRKQYVTADGVRMNDAQVTDFLRAAYETISTDGLNKTAPGQFTGSGAKANKGSESRQIHFKDGESYAAYLSDYGRGSMYDAMVSHIGGMARDIGLVERYGPNPNAQFKLQNDLAARAEPDGKATRVFGNKPQAYWDLISGVTGTPESARLAQIGQDARNIQTFGKLAGAVISSITDIGTLMVTAGYHRLSYWDLFKNIKRQAASQEWRDLATQHGIIAESMIGDLNRFAGENIANNWSGRLANATMKLSLMNAWTDTLRRGFSMTMQQGLAKLSTKKWGELAKRDREHLGRKGITEADWEVVTAGELTDIDGNKFLTPEAIMASGHPDAPQVVSKILGFITDESEYAVLNPDTATRAIQTWGGQQAGTGVGELARLTMQFKSFPTAMISRHWRRMLEDGLPITSGETKMGAAANKAAYAASLAITTTALGAIVFQAKQIKDGKDPVDMTTPKFWTRAIAQGGGAGFLGDILLGDTTGDRGQLDSLGRLAFGPTFGSVADLYELTKGNIDEAIAGKDTHAGAEALRFAKGHAPLVSLWYSKAALDHLLLNGIQENLSSGYLQRVQAKAKHDWNQNWWWKPGDKAPERAPDLTAIGGR